MKEELGFYREKYDFDAINHLYKESSLRECAIQAYFSKYGIVPLSIVYEDFIGRCEETIKSILEYLEIENSNVKIGEKYYQKISNSESEKWVQRFRKDLQEKMRVEIW